MSIPPGDKPGQAGWMNSPKFLAQQGILRFCDGCKEKPNVVDGKPVPLKRCTRCNHAWYHDKECQLGHQSEHKQQCKIWAATIKNEPKLEDYPFVEELEHDAVMESDRVLYDHVRSGWDQESLTWDNVQFGVMNGFFYEQFFLPDVFNGDRNKQFDVILEFGCATATLSAKYMTRHAKKVIALDISPKMIDKVNERYGDVVEGVAGIICDLEDPTIQEFRNQYRGKVDLIVSTIALPFIPRRQCKATFLAFYDLLKPGGLFAHADTHKTMPGATYPTYMTREECETYYKWGKLEKVMWERKIIELKGPGGEMRNPGAFGVAKKV